MMITMMMMMMVGTCLFQGGHAATKDQETLPVKDSFMTSEHHIEQLSQNASVMPVIYHPERKRKK